MSATKGKTPKTVLDKIVYAIRSQPPTTKGGVSRAAIIKYLKSELDYDNPSAIKKALVKAVKSDKLVQTGQSFWVAGDKARDLPPEEKVIMNDIKVGKGEEVTSGDTVIVKYEGKLKDGTVFDSASSFDFVLGAGDVIKGWDQGIAGMKVGGKRKLEVPSSLGYGKRGCSPDIPPNADLFFTVTLRKVVPREG